MVEMRWLVREYEMRYDDIEGIAPDYMQEQVLQYRYKLDIERRVSEIWSEWIDVPTVTEGKNNAG